MPLVIRRRKIGMRRPVNNYSRRKYICASCFTGAPTKNTTSRQSAFLYRPPTPHRTHLQKATAAESCTATNKRLIIPDKSNSAGSDSSGSLVFPSAPPVCGGTPLGVVVEPLVCVPASQVACSGRSASCVAAPFSIVAFAPCDDVSCHRERGG